VCRDSTWRVHHETGHSIGFLLMPVIGGAHDQLLLRFEDRALRGEAFCLNQLCDAMVAQCSLQLECG
jgi:hypothetical protein